MSGTGIRKVVLGLALSILLGSGVAVASLEKRQLEAYNSGDYKTALAELMPLAEQRNADAQFWIGALHDDGKVCQ